MFDENYRLTRRRLGPIELKYLQERMMAHARIGTNATELAAAAVEFFANQHWAQDGNPLFEAQTPPEYHYGFNRLSEVEANHAYNRILASQRSQPPQPSDRLSSNARIANSFMFNELVRRHQ